MQFDQALLETYRTLLQTTNLQKAYQEWLRMFRYLRTALEQQLPEYRFQGSVSENGMDYAYFSFTSPLLKEQGLKLVAVFVPERFQLEVWLSGVNRAAQCRWASRLGPCLPPMEQSKDPTRTDYLARLPVQADLADGEAVVQAVKHAVEQLLALLPPES